MNHPSRPKNRRRRTLAWSAAGLLVPAAGIVVGLLPAEAAYTGQALANGRATGATGCLTATGTAAGTAVTIGACDTAWTTTATGEIRTTIGGVTRCLDAAAGGTANGTPLILWPCQNSANQRFAHTGKAITGTQSGRCVDLRGGATAAGTPTVLWDCRGNRAQTWTPKAPTGPAPTAAPGGAHLDDPAKKDIAMRIVSTAENSSLDWRAQFAYIEDIRDGRGYTAGIIGFCSGTSDMLALVQEYTRRAPGNVLAPYLPALRSVDGTDSHAGLGTPFTDAWKRAAADEVFQKTQEDERDRQYFNPSVAKAKADGVRALGQFAYYDAAVMHGFSGMNSIRSAALRSAKPPAQGGTEAAWLKAFLDARVVEMRTEAAHEDTSRVHTAQRRWLDAGNLDLNTPLSWSMYGEQFGIN